MPINIYSDGDYYTCTWHLMIMSACFCKFLGRFRDSKDSVKYKVGAFKMLICPYTTTLDNIFLR